MIADRIKYFRSLRKKTQVNLANEASIDYRHFQKLEAGQSDFKISTIFKLSNALSIPACHLLQFDPFIKDQEHACPNSIVNQLGIGLVAVDKSSRIVYCNRHVAELLGMSSEAEVMQGCDVGDLFLESGIQHAEYRNNVLSGRITSDMVRFQIKMPRTREIKVVASIWSQVLDHKTMNVKGYVAAVWDCSNCRDLSVLPVSSQTV